MSGQPSTILHFVQSRHAVVSALGVTQILGYGTTFYLLAVLALPMSKDTGWTLDRIAIGLSIGLLVGGLVAPLVGRAVDRHGGRPVLMAGSLCIAIGLAGLGWSPNLILYWIAWAIVGLGMAAALYDAAFSALGGWYRDGARGPITTVTLWGGFASTLCWPVAAYLVATVGWRWTCFGFAACHLMIALPLHAWMMPRSTNTAAVSGDSAVTGGTGAHVNTRVFMLIASSMTLASIIVTIIAVHLIALLQEYGLTAVAAVAVGALIGPSQVAGRFGEFVLGHRLHPIWSALAAAVLMVAGIVILTHDVRFAAVAIIIYAMGAGVSYIVRGTLPLAMFGSDGYATLMGRIALPSMIAQGLAPLAGAIVLEKFGADALLGTLVALTILNVAAIGSVAMSYRRRSA